MTENFEGLINNIYRDIAMLSFPLHIKPKYYTVTNRDVVIDVNTIDDLKPALLRLIKEAAPSIDEVSVGFDLYNDTFSKCYHVYNPYIGDIDELFERIFENTKETKKEQVGVYEITEDGEGQLWKNVLQKLQNDYGIKIVKTSDEDEVDFSDKSFHLEYEFITMPGEEFEDYVTLTKSDLAIIATVLSFSDINQFLVLSKLSVDAQSLLKNLYYRNNVYAVSPDNPMAAHIAGKADVIISDYEDYNYINIWELNKDVTIVNLKYDDKFINPLKERHYDNIDKIYYIKDSELDLIACKTIVKLWNQTRNE